ncbi:Hypoxanthine phosphoribosyltransferase [Fusobacterium sp. DD29]|uniref:hypoxanthine phosphoribosyltransferase n=1 Tax=unclassified Fusobacterium TaxID=2648384 RepID=UPI001B8DA405|nr:Hypoxanthine phosphoribosyltransferase [Fusobacterium sp. DD45]MBR8710382.1 Hypoxanthine phosphoribosyltransferase [Fusobacterium sp. DD28]MBR8749373.1 Hypoxanthine phosphoribosyltransferase [Fusobacterium sp. DD29]MBR8750984.1 Hypoxanthine phosphoribosyltransferase [Fusobacterium sp. DD26]MBR8761735.1 Hypoxanthine phosphoribosyltransferase [Fusobacterium sp. DD25]MBR8767648.1 Hypoxanthine phosphoribosyltransferase [Fusobacterium sp. DD43]MBR8772067.1 Hypoxanthine phosphoribosyltransferase
MDYTIKTLLTRETVEKRIKELASQIEKDYEGKDLLVLGLLKGSIVFMTDLIKEINLPLVIDFMSVSSYSGTTSTGVVNISKDTDIDVKGKDVLIVEDIIDTGLTLSNVKKLLEKRGTKSLKICTLLDKPSRRTVDMKGDYVGFEIPDEFVVGYGLDYDQLHRNLPYIGIVVKK